MMTSKRKYEGKKGKKRARVQTPRHQRSSKVTDCVPTSQEEDDICVVDWNSPKPLSGQVAELPLADIVANLATIVDPATNAEEVDPLLCPSFPLRYSSPPTNDLPATPPKAGGAGRQPTCKQLQFNRAIIDKMIATINECKQKDVSKALPDSVPNTPRSVRPTHLDRRGSPLSVTNNRSTDELWTDTEDESFVRATQGFMDNAGLATTAGIRSLTPSPSSVGPTTPARVGPQFIRLTGAGPLFTTSTSHVPTDVDVQNFLRPGPPTPGQPTPGGPMVTSTPNVRNKSSGRRPFSTGFVVPSSRHFTGSKSSASAASASPLATSSPARDSSFSDDLLASLAEPDELLDSQFYVGPAATLPTSVSGNSVGILKEESSGSCTMVHDCRPASASVCTSTATVDCVAVLLSGHDSFQSDNDSFALPEICALIDQAEAMATQQTPTDSSLQCSSSVLLPGQLSAGPRPPPCDLTAATQPRTTSVNSSTALSTRTSSVHATSKFPGTVVRSSGFPATMPCPAKGSSLPSKFPGMTTGNLNAAKVTVRNSVAPVLNISGSQLGKLRSHTMQSSLPAKFPVVTARISGPSKRSSTGSSNSATATSSVPTNLKTSIVSSDSSKFPKMTVGNPAPCILPNPPPVQRSSMCSLDEIERKKRDAVKKRQSLKPKE